MFKGLKNLFVVLVLFSLVGLTTCSRSELPPDTLVIINGEKIPLSAFTSKYPRGRLANKDDNYIKGRLDAFIRQKLFTLAGKELGYDKDPDVQAKIEKLQRKHMLQYVYQRAILDRILNDRYLRDLYDKSKYEIKARHILIGFKGARQSRATRSKSEALALMARIQQKLKAGTPFEELAEEYSEDPSSKKNGGDLGWFTWGRMVDPFQEVAFKLDIGEVSDVVETPYGLHLIKLEGRRERSMGTFEEEKENLKRQGRRIMAPVLRDTANYFLDSLKKAAHFEIINKNFNELLNVIRGSRYKTRKLDEMFKKLKFNKPFFRLNGKELGAQWIIKQLKPVEFPQKPLFQSENQFKTVLDNLVTQQLIVDYGFAHGYDKEPDFRSKIDKYSDRYIKDAFVKKEISSKIRLSDAEVENYYQQHKNDKYLDREKVQVQEIFVKDEKLARELRKRIDAGENFGLLAEKYTERPAGKGTKGELPAFARGRYGRMGQEAFKLKPGEVAGPIKLGNGWSIIKLEKHIKPGPKPLAKVKGQVQSDLKKEIQKKKADEWDAKLRRKYGVKVNYQAVLDYFHQKPKEKKSA